MKNKKFIFIYLLFLAALGIAFTFFRSGVISKKIDNINSFIPIENYESLNSISEKEIQSIQQERFLIIYDGEDSTSITIKNNAAKSLEYMKKSVDTVEISKFKALMYQYTSVIITFENLDKFNRFEELTNYVNGGGNLLFAMRPVSGETLKKYKNIMGISDIAGLVDSTGLTLLSNVMINAEGFTINQEFMTNSCIELSLNSSCRLHARTVDGIPLLWDVNYGDGKIMVFNGSMLNEKINRGFLSGAISLLSEDFIYPIINTKLTFIDDFPAPISQGQNKRIFNEYNMDNDEFYRTIWWPNILEGALKYGVKYSGLVIETYNDKVTKPFTIDNSVSNESLYYYGRELLRSGGELGIHGYNHQSLALEGYIIEDLGYNPWPDQQNMEYSLKEVNRFVRDAYPNYKLRSYVPPSNKLSPEGRKAITKALPDIKVISSLYSQNYEGDSYSQEFEVSKDGIVEFPRISYSYTPDQEIMWSIYNGINLHGVFSHFIHPDDVLDDERSQNKPWSQLLSQYNKLLGTIKEDYGWLRPMVVSQAAEELKKYSETKVYIVRKDGYIFGYCNDFRKDSYFILRTAKKPVSTIQCKATKIDEGTYLIYTDKPDFCIKLESEKK